MLAVIGVFPGQVVVTWGTRMSTASNAAIIMLAIPVCTAFFAYIFLREKMTPVRWFGFAVAIAGGLLCSLPDLHNLSLSGRYLAGNALVLAGMLGSAFYNSYGKKILERYTPLEMLFYTYLGMLVVMTPLVLTQERDVVARIPQFTASTWLGLILLTVFHNYLSMVLFLKALKQLDATQAALGNYLITFFGVPIAIFMLGERLGGASWVGALLVLASTLLVTLWKPRETPEAVPATVPES
jgi:drug/metabolite transporter (DMT)-like permease